MKKTELIMGMPISVELIDHDSEANFRKVFDYFRYVDEKFSTYKKTSEITQINEGFVKRGDYSQGMKEVLELCEQTMKATDGYFDIIARDGTLDPSGLVKGWSIYNAAKILEAEGCEEFYIDAGGDVEARGKIWKIGLKNPFKQEEIIKVVYVQDRGVATSGTYIRGQHVYNPYHKTMDLTDIVSFTVIGPNIYEADRFATAAFAMGRKGIEFIEELDSFEGYMIDNNGIAIMTSGFKKYTDA